MAAAWSVRAQKMTMKEVFIASWKQRVGSSRMNRGVEERDGGAIMRTDSGPLTLCTRTVSPSFTSGGWRGLASPNSKKKDTARVFVLDRDLPLEPLKMLFNSL